MDNALALIDALDLQRRHAGRPRLGRPDRPGRPARAHATACARVVLMNTWAWELPSFLPPFLREFRTEGLGEILALGGNLFVESIPGGMHRRDPDPMMMDAYRAPFPDYWSRAGTLAFQREIPLTERDRSAPLMASIHERLPHARRARCCSSGACATRSSSRSSSSSGASCSRTPRRSSWPTPLTSSSRTTPTR